MVIQGIITELIQTRRKEGRRKRVREERNNAE